MNLESLPLISALWLGILTSISPCPLASNIAAMCYITGGTGRLEGGKASRMGIYYTLGRMIAYTMVAGVVVKGLLTVPVVAQFLQKNMNMMLGPVLLCAGLVMLDFLHLNFRGVDAGNGLVERLKARGPFWGSLFLGVVLAFSFCPVSAALFFGSLIPLAVAQKSSVLFPLMYGAGTAAPVVAAAVALAFGVDITGRFFQAGRRFGGFAKRATGFVFVIVGSYYIYEFILSGMIA